MNMATGKLVLASTSPYRRELLARLQMPFDTARPEVDETPDPGAAPDALALRLARSNAEAIARHQSDAWVIGSDQVAAFDGRSLGKPGGRAAAVAQLQAMSGRDVLFHTAVAVLRGHETPRLHLDTTRVHFRTLSQAEIERYVDAEQPYDCAGSFKSEGLGITLFDAICSDDPTALIGLPLIATTRLLREVGFALP